MAITTGGIFTVLWKMRLLGQEMLNVLWYVSSDSANDHAQELLDELVTDVLPVYRAAVSNELVFEEIRVIEALTLLPDAVHISGLPGLRAGSTGAPFEAAGLRLLRAEKVVRDGSKRIPGLLDTDAIQGVLIASAITLLINLGDALTAQLTGPTVAFIPIIVNRASFDDGGFPVTYAQIAAFQVNPFVTSQVTRKRGRGD